MYVDTWLGRVYEYLINEYTDQFLNDSNSPDLFNLFMKNIINNNLQNTIIPFRLLSICAGRILYSYGIKFDIIYIDASHDYYDVKLDLLIYWELLDNKGTFFGDDYNLPGVRKAVDELY